MIDLALNWRRYESLAAHVGVYRLHGDYLEGDSEEFLEFIPGEFQFACSTAELAQMAAAELKFQHEHLNYPGLDTEFVEYQTHPFYTANGAVPFIELYEASATVGGQSDGFPDCHLRSMPLVQAANLTSYRDWQATWVENRILWGFEMQAWGESPGDALRVLQKAMADAKDMRATKVGALVRAYEMQGQVVTPPHP